MGLGDWGLAGTVGFSLACGMAMSVAEPVPIQQWGQRRLGGRSIAVDPNAQLLSIQQCPVSLRTPTSSQSGNCYDDINTLAAAATPAPGVAPV